MRFEGPGTLLRVFIGESDRFEGRPLYQAIVEKARSTGIAGATVLRGIEGFGASSHLHTSRILRMSEDLPVVVEVVDTEENIERILPAIDSMLDDGMVTLERVDVRTYRGSTRDSSAVEERLRMLRVHARSIPSSTDTLSALSDAILAAHEYGASVDALSEATGLDEVEIERVVGSQHGAGSEQ